MEGTFLRPHVGGQWGPHGGRGGGLGVFVTNTSVCSPTRITGRKEQTRRPEGRPGAAEGPRWLWGRVWDGVQLPAIYTEPTTRARPHRRPLWPQGAVHTFPEERTAPWLPGTGGAGGGVRPKASDSPGCIPPGPAFVMSCAGAAWGHTPALALGGSGGTVPSPGVVAPDPSCPQPTARASDPRAPSALSTRVRLPESGCLVTDQAGEG